MSTRRVTRSIAQNGDSHRAEDISSDEIPSIIQSDDMSTYTSQTASPPATASSGPATSRKLMRHCTVCKQNPKEPHAVFCCGSIYCHVCLVKLMTAAHQKQDQARCVACQKPMGEKPPVKNNRQQKINEAAEATKRAHQKESIEGPPQKMRQPSNGTTHLHPRGSGSTLERESAPPILQLPAQPPLRGSVLPGLGSVQTAGPIGRQIDNNTRLAQLLQAQREKIQNQPAQRQSPYPTLPGYNTAPGHLRAPLAQNGQTGNHLSPEIFYTAANGQPQLRSSATANTIATANASLISSASSCPSLPGEQPPMAIVKQEPMDTNEIPLPSTGNINGNNGNNTVTQPAYTPSLAGQPSYIPSPLYLQSNPHRSKLARQILFDEDFLPRQPDPYKAEEKLEQEQQHLLASKNLFQAENSKPVFGPPCVICWDGSKEPLATLCCDKIFCKLCILEEIRLRKRCPNCSKEFTPNDTLETIVRPLTVSKPIKPAPQPQATDIDMAKFKEKFKDLDEFTISALINQLNELREDKYKEKKSEPLRVVSMGYMDFIKKCKYEMATIQRQMEAALQDKKFIDGGYARECSLYGKVFSAVAGTAQSSHPPLPSGDSVMGSAPATVPSLGEYTPTLTPDEIVKNERLKKHFDAFCALYFEVFNKYSVYSNEDPDFSAQNRVSAMVEVANGITKYATVKKIGALNYDTEQNPSMSIVSSLEFDHTGNRFVVAGVTKKIKIFHFDSFLENPTKVQFPANQLMCQSKISNVSWSPDQENILASSDYDGHVSVWDLETTKIVRTFKEHERRCWTVHFNNVEPKLMASGSDDSKVKLWNINCDRSVAQIEARVNVCCVYFSPTKSNELVFGSADHCVHLYDIRNTTRPLNVFKGHRKAVSYVRYINPNEVVSASTDSSLRVWNLKEGRCTKILKGHINEKNFVGLSGNGDHVMCGSENSKAFFYYKGLSEPVASYTVANYSGPGRDTGAVPTDAFVSSVCWKKDSDYAMVANSQGKVQLLHIA